jgi:uncharacterized delta-60 repeat protein
MSSREVMGKLARRCATWASGVTLIALAAAAVAWGAGGARDPAFSGDGKAVTDLSARGDFAGAVAVQTNGKIVVAGSAAFDGRDPKFALVRYKANGTIDTSFGGGDGTVRTNFTPREDAIYGVAIQPDGKIVAAGDAGFRTGNSRFALARYDADGTLDPSFGNGGKVTTNWTSGNDPVSSLVLQSDGKIVVAGGAGHNFRNPKLAVARYDSNGDLDPTFGHGDGKVRTDVTPRKDYANAVTLQPDGKIIAGGIGSLPTGPRAVFELVRYGADGMLDTSFSDDGKRVLNFTRMDDSVQGVVVLPGGDILAGGISNFGRFNGNFALARFNANGTLDTGFGGDGKVTTSLTAGDDEAWDIVLQPDGKVVAAGDARGRGGRFAAVRYGSDGSLDPTFGSGGVAFVNFTARDDFALGVTAQPADGNLVLAGGSGWGGPNPKFAVARLLDE